MQEAVFAHLRSNLLRERRAQKPNKEQQADEETTKKQKLEQPGRHSSTNDERSHDGPVTPGIERHDFPAWADAIGYAFRPYVNPEVCARAVRPCAHRMLL